MCPTTCTTTAIVTMITSTAVCSTTVDSAIYDASSIVAGFFCYNFVIDNTFGAVSICQCCHPSEKKEVLILIFSIVCSLYFCRIASKTTFSGHNKAVKTEEYE